MKNNKKETELKIKQLEAEIKIEKENIKFYGMSPAQKRVSIAKDVILQIKTKRFISMAGNGYIENEELDALITDESNECELKSILNKTKNPCIVCGIGSLFVSEISKRNNFKVNTDIIDSVNKINSEKIKKRFKGIFSEHQLDLIETAFEKRVVNEDNNLLGVGEGFYLGFCFTKLAEKYINFGKSFKEDNDRLIAIMNNIIVNNGTFKV